MKIALFGATGCVGSSLVKFWLEKGHSIIFVTRKDLSLFSKNDNIISMTWKQLEENPFVLERLDGLVNLVGEPIQQRWTIGNKQKIISSRIQSIQCIQELLHHVQEKPKVVVQASAIGIYGTSSSVVFDEQSPTQSSDFLGHVCIQWEKEAKKLQTPRLVYLRLGVVLDPQKGAFPLIKMPYILGFGGKIGTGSQWVSWIHNIDVARLIDFIVHNPEISGPVNATSPYATTNDELGKTVGKVYRRPHWCTVPSAILKCTLGEMACLVLDGQQVLPQVALKNNFTFTFPHLIEAVEHLYICK